MKNLEMSSSTRTFVLWNTGQIWKDDQEFHRYILSMGTENAVKKVIICSFFLYFFLGFITSSICAIDIPRYKKVIICSVGIRYMACVCMLKCIDAFCHLHQLAISCFQE